VPRTIDGRTLRLWVPVAVYMAVIFYVSSLHEAPLPAAISDKSAHGLGYVGLAVTIVRAVAGGLPARVSAGIAAASLSIAVAYGASDEVHQMFVPGRTADLADLAADAIGALVGVAACWAWGIISIRGRARGPS
jgi:VanZ family protein